MLTLDLLAEPYWLDQPRGVRVDMRPAVTATRMMTMVLRNQQAAAEYG